VLFDLQSGRRRNVVRIIYGFLAALFLIGFVLFGIGGEVSLDPGELFGGSDEPEASQFDSQIEDAENRLAKDPKDGQALSDLARYRYLAGQQALEPDAETGLASLTEETEQQWGPALDAWERYLKTDPKDPDPQVAGTMICAYDPTNPLCGIVGVDPSSIDPAGAAETQEILVEDQPNAQNYAFLAFYRYSDGDLQAGEAAADAALAEASGSQRKDLEKGLDQIAKSAEAAVKQQEKAGPKPDEAPAGTSLSNPFGGLGSGAAPPGGAPPAP
jgi:hypothetical protein